MEHAAAEVNDGDNAISVDTSRGHVDCVAGRGHDLQGVEGSRHGIVFEALVHLGAGERP